MKVCYVFLGCEDRVWTVAANQIETLRKVLTRTQYLNHMARPCLTRRATNVRAKETELRTAKTKKRMNNGTDLGTNGHKGFQKAATKVCKKQPHRLATATKTCKKQPQRLESISHKGLQSTATKA